MNHWIIAPVILPALLAPLIILWMRHDIVLARVFSTLGTAALIGIAVWLNVISADGEITVYRLGNWPAPFGIVLVLDRLAALMILLTGILALVVQFYAIGSGWDKRGWHFHALWQFQLMGVCGAFLTGDAFNLFVFFEVLLIASYGLMIHAGGGLRLRAGVQYVVYNLAGSTLFLAALGVLYAVTGTLNMADLAGRVAEMPASDSALLRTGAVLLMLVFAVKAALVPLHFWLPSTYANAPGPVAALFAIMSKVGIYGIIRFFSLVFPQDGAIENMATDLLLPAALITMVIGMIGVLGARNLSRQAAFAAIGSVGTLMLAVAQFDQYDTTAALYYLLHSTFSAAMLFLVVDMIAARRNGDVWLHVTRPLIGRSGLVASLFFAAAIAVAGMPPLSGFIGKLMILNATRDMPDAPWVWGAILITSLMAIVGMTRAGSVVFWKCWTPENPPPAPYDRASDVEVEAEQANPAGTPSYVQALGPAPWLAFASVMTLLALMVALTVAAGPVTNWMAAISEQLFNPADYINAVLTNQGATK
ncbi:monovalent cation/H+ antiporter subunit D [Paracoccus pacificus]|uniref:Monovalent cation/H+ antiporter subunit D n=1 Tax=Paracoccus pacificus TaxID=1463598 RepID=A0ABW4R901_9RHOB